MNNKSKGSALAQYGIVIALIALGCFAGYLLYGKSIQDALTKYLAGQTDLSTQMEANANIASNNVPSTPTPKAGSLGGTPTNPKEDCVNGSCTVDYGDFILNGIPEDFQEFTEAQGTSGGTDKLAAIINQMADQLEEDGQLAEAQELRNFANLLSFMADIESDYVDAIQACPSASDPRACYENSIANTSITVPNELTDAGILTTFSTNTLNSTNTQSLLVPGFAVDVIKALSPEQAAQVPNEKLTYAFITSYQNIMNNPAYSTEMKNVIDQSYYTASLMAQNMYTQIDTLAHNNRSISAKTADPRTGSWVFETRPSYISFNTLKKPPKSDNPTLNIP